MIRLRKILFPTDFSACADRAFDYALLMAQRFGAELEMFHAVVLHEDDPHNPAHHFPDPGEIHERLRGLADASMSRLAERGAATDASIRQVTARGIAAAPTILEHAAEWAPDLIVMGTEGRRGPSHLLLGSVAEEVVAHASCPVLTVRGGDEAAPVQAVEKILVPVDLSEHSGRSLRVALGLAASYGAKVQALHVVEDVIYPSYFGQTIDVTRELVSGATAALDEFVAGVAAGAEVEREVVVGQRAAPEVLRFAETHGSDLVIVASHGLGAVEEFLFGSTAKRIVQHSKVPVLVLKAFGRSLLDAD